MMSFSELWKHFKLLSPPEALSQEERSFLERFLREEYQLREKKRIEYLMRTSGIISPRLIRLRRKRIKYLHDFDWSFPPEADLTMSDNPKIPREKIMEFINTDWLKKPSNLLIIGPAGTGKTHIATALCHDAITKGHQTIFITLFDLVAKLSRTNNPFSSIEYYAKVPILCLPVCRQAGMNWATSFPQKNKQTGSFKSSLKEQNWQQPLLQQTSSPPTGERSLTQ